MSAELGRLPDVTIPEDQGLVAATGAEGVPFVLAQPNARASQEVVGIVQRLMAPPGAEGAAAQDAPASVPTPSGG